MGVLPYAIGAGLLAYPFSYSSLPDRNHSTRARYALQLRARNHTKRKSPEIMTFVSARSLQFGLGKKFDRAISYPSQGEVETDPQCYMTEEVYQIVYAGKGQDKV
jgi:hypothetical protein